MEKKQVTVFIAGAVLIIAGIVFLILFINKENLSDICKSGVLLVTGILFWLLTSSSKNKDDEQNSNG